ncbi:MAG: hypothetical protein K2X27_15930 [Candidatus Obscuribacterales bacterium]|nr:hypothetical protein [Candidatus Obscuribacterales bacterium]
MDKRLVINRALSFLGERSITNPDAPETPSGKFMVDQFDQARREVLRRYPWNFAETWANCDRTTAPVFGYSDAYSLPPDFLRLLIVGDVVSNDDRNRNYRLLNQGSPDFRKVIALNNCGAPKLPIAYTADITLLSQWDSLAIKVFAIWLAMDAAKSITGEDSQVKTLNDLLSEELKDAVAVDGQEQPMRMQVFSNVQRERDYAQFGGEGFFTNVAGYY